MGILSSFLCFHKYAADGEDMQETSVKLHFYIMLLCLMRKFGKGKKE